MNDIVADREDGPTGCSISRDLAVLAAGLDTRFLRAGTTLATAIEMIDRIIGGLDGIVTALDEKTAGAAVVDMRAIAGRLNELPEHQRDRARRMAEVCEIASRLSDHVLEMHETLRVLSIYGMSIKIAASGESQFVGFVANMQVKLAAGERHLAGFIRQLKQLIDAVANVRQADRLLAGESAKALPDVPAGLAGDAGELAAHLVGVTRLASDLAEIARSVQATVAIVLGALQVGDSTRQRLEHVVSALQILDTHVEQAGISRDPAVIAHIDRLLAAQVARVAGR